MGFWRLGRRTATSNGNKTEAILLLSLKRKFPKVSCSEHYDLRGQCCAVTRLLAWFNLLPEANLTENSVHVGLKVLPAVTITMP
jgi:hypothetical protein